MNQALISRAGTVAALHVVDEKGGHGTKAPSILTAIASALINGLLMFGLCCAYGMIMFQNNSKHAGLGVKMNLSTAFLSGLLLAIFSKVPVAVGGPDLNPVVFLGMFVNVISATIAEEMKLPSPSSRRLAGGGTNVQFCIGAHLEENGETCALYDEELVATTVFSVAFSSLFICVIFCVIGAMRLTKVVGFVPASVMEAFLACVGYKVFKYSVLFCDLNWHQLFPAMAIGVTLYYLKANHVGHPAIVMLTGILVPLGIFYIILYGAGLTVDDARESRWMFDVIEDSPFYTIWTKSLGNYSRINYKAWLATLPDLALMTLVVLLDCLLKISSTETKLPVACDKDYEIKLFGIGNIATALCGSSVGYMQLKFNVINFGVIGNVVDRRAGILYALFCAVPFFWTIEVFNYFPRFFLSSLLFFAGSGFVAENLWGSVAVMTTIEVLTIVSILAVFVFTEKLHYAVAVGILLTCLTFLMKYSRIPAVMGTPFPAGDVTTRDRRTEIAQRNIDHIVSSWALVVRLKGFVFFASVIPLLESLHDVINEQERNCVPAYRRFRVVVLDCSMLDGLDASAAKAVKKFSAFLETKRIQIFWTALQGRLLQDLKMRTVIGQNYSHVYDLLEQAVLHMEHLAVNYLVEIQMKWLGLHSEFQRHHSLAFNRATTDSFEALALHDSARFGCPLQYCSRMSLKSAPRTVLWRSGCTVRSLYYVQSGSVGLYAHEDLIETEEPFRVYQKGSFLNVEFVIRKAQRFCAVALDDGEVISWNETQWSAMARKAPFMLSRIERLCFEQHRFSVEAERRSAHAVHHGGSDLQRDHTVYLPSDLAMRTQLVRSGEVLHAKGFFEPVADDDPDVLIPVLPSMIRSDLCIAFYTFSETSVLPGQRIEGVKRYLASSSIREALIYSGMGDVILKNKNTDFITEDEFLEIGQESFFAPLSKRNQQTLKDIFEHFDADNSGTLDVDELTNLLRECLKTEVNAETVDGIVLVWNEKVSEDGSSNVNTINYETFVAVMSRYIRRCEPYWNLVRALQDCTGMSIQATSKLSLTMFENTELFKSQPEKLPEMLWAFDWLTGGGGDGLEVDLSGILAGLSMSFRFPTLPSSPEPNLKEAVAQLARTRLLRSLEPEPPPLLDNFRARHLLDLRGKAFSMPTSIDHPVQSTLQSLTEDGVPVCNRTTMMAIKQPEPQEEISLLSSVHRLLEVPQSSNLGKALACTTALLIIASILTLFVGDVLYGHDEDGSAFGSSAWGGIEIAFSVIFAVELAVRLIVHRLVHSRNKNSFSRFLPDVCDFLAIVVLPVELVLGKMIRELALFRLFRLARLYRLATLTGVVGTGGDVVPPVIFVLLLIWAMYFKYHY